jgi:CheY-like chemotaxis protein
VQVASNSSKDTRPTILLINDDDDTHPTLKNSLRKQGYRVLHATGLEDAIDWIDGGFVHADMVLVDIKGKTTDDNLNVGRHIRKHAKYNDHTPLVVMPENYGKDVEGTEVNVDGNDWVFYLGEAPNQLLKLLGQLLPKQSALQEEPVI